jgi:hypothetical protein
MPNTWPISITVLNNAGDMAYGVSVQHVSSGDKINWSSDSGSFTLTFRDSVLNEGLTIQSTTVKPYTAFGTVKSGAPLGCHPYSVDAVYDATGETHHDPACPEIVVQ